MGDDFCKNKSVEVASPEYQGLHVLVAAAVRGTGAQVEDHRPDFCGHAHIDVGITVPPKGVPFLAERSELLQKRCEAILAAGTYRPDPDIASPGWSGTPL
jgi:hypothetical protein